MDELYFEEGYVEAKYFVYTANATAGFSPYFVEGYFPNDYFEDRGAFASLYCDAEIVVGMLMEAQAYISSLATLSAIAYKVTETTASLNSEFTQTAIASRTKDIDLFALSDAAIAVEVSRIRDNNTEASAVFDVAVDFVVERSADADVDALFSAIISGLRSRDVNLETQAAFSFDVQTDLFKDFNSSLSAEASVSVSVEVTRTVDASISAEATSSTDGNRIRFGIADAVSEFTINATARQIRDAHLTGTGVATIQCDPTFTAVSSALLQTAITVSFNGGKLKTYNSQIRSHFFVFVSRRVAESRPKNLTELSLRTEPVKFGSHSATPGNGSANSIHNVRPPLDQDWVIEAWLYNPGAFTYGNYPYRIAYPSIAVSYGGVNFGWSSAFSSSTGTVGFWSFDIVKEDAPNSGSTHFASVGSFTTFDVWRHFAVVQTGSTVSLFVNGSRVATTSQPIKYWKSDIAFFGSSVGEAYVDEMNVLYGNTYGYNANNTTITVPTSARTNTIYTQGLWHFDGNQLDDYTLLPITHSGEAAITSQATQTTKANGTLNHSANISSEFAVTAVVGTLQDINLVALEDAELVADATVIRSGISEISSEISVSAVVERSRDTTSNQECQSSVSVDGYRIKQFSSDLVSEASTLILANEFEGVFADLSSRFYTAHIFFDDEYLESDYYEQFETNVGKISVGSADFTVTFALTVSIRTDVFVAMVVNSSAAVVADVVKTTDVTVLEVSEFALTATAEKISDIFASSTAVFTVFCNGVTAAEINLVAFANASLSAKLDGDKPGSAELAVTATIYAYTQDSLNSVGEADISSEFSLSAIGNYTVDNVIITEAIASNLTVAVKSVAVDIPLDSNFTLTADVDRARATAITVSANSSVSVAAVKTTDVDSQVSSEFTQTSVVRKVVDAVITTEAVASNLTAVVRLAGLFITCDISASVAAISVVNRSAASAINATAQINVDATKFVNADAAINSNASIAAVIGSRKQFASVIASALSFVVAIRDLRIDEIVYVIPGENWNYKIISETRLHDIYGETRVRSITGETRNRTIAGESRIHILE